MVSPRSGHMCLMCDECAEMKGIAHYRTFFSAAADARPVQGIKSYEEPETRKKRLHSRE